MKNVIKQYVDSSLEVLTYLKKKYEKKDINEAVLRGSETLLREIDTLLGGVVDEQSEDAVQLVWKICNAIKAWENDVAQKPSLFGVNLFPLHEAVQYTRQWSLLYSRWGKKAKTPIPEYSDPLLQLFVDYEKYFAEYLSVQTLWEEANDSATFLQETDRTLMFKLYGACCRYDALETERKHVWEEMQGLYRDIQENPAKKEEAIPVFNEMKKVWMDLDGEIKTLARCIKTKSDVPESCIVEWGQLLDDMEYILSQMTSFIEDESSFVAIAKAVDFPRMERILQGTADIGEIHLLRESLQIVEGIIHIKMKQDEK